MANTTCTHRRYDHRLKELVRTTQDIECAVRQGVSRSTASGWLADPGTEVVTIDIVNMKVIQLQEEVLQLRRRVQKRTALLRVLLAVLKISGYSLSQARLPEGKDKNSLLRAIDRGRSILPCDPSCVSSVCRHRDITTGIAKSNVNSTMRGLGSWSGLLWLELRCNCLLGRGVTSRGSG